MPEHNGAALDGAERVSRRRPRIAAARLALTYAIVAGIWILASDWALFVLVPVGAPLPWLNTAKGIAFVGVTGGLLYALLARAWRAQERIEATLALNEARHHRLTERAPDIIYQYRLLPEPGFEYVSPSIATLTGYTPEEHYADPAISLTMVHPDDRGLMRDLLVSGASREPILIRWVCRDGRVILTEHRVVAIRDGAGQVVAVEGVARDVTERERSAARLRLLETALQAAASAVVIVDREGTIQWANEAFTGLTGYSADEAVGQTPRLLSSGQHDAAFYRDLWSTVTEGQVWRGDLVNRRKDGSLYFEEQTITPVRGEGGAITHFIAIKQDVSERVVREREQRALATLAAALRRTASREELPPALFGQLRALVGAEGAALAMRDSATGEVVFEAGFGLWAGAGGRRLAAGEGRTGQVIATGGCAVLAAEEPPEGASGHLALGRAAVCAPLRAQEEIVGALWLDCPAPPDPDELRLVEAIAAMAGSAINRATMHEQTAQRLRRLTSLHVVDQAIASSLDVGLTLTTVLEQVTAQLGVDAAAVLLLDPHAHELRYSFGRGFRTATVMGAVVRLGLGPLGEAVLARRPLALPSLPAEIAPYDRDALLSAEGFAAYFAIPLVAKGQVKGALEIFHRAPLTPNGEWLHFLEALAAQAAIAIDNAELFERLQRANDELALAYDSTLEGWARALELRDRETEGHSRRVTGMTERLARALGVPEDQMIHIRRGALLHDIGKMGVPDAILRKPGPLTPEEWAQMREHPAYAQQLLSPIVFLQPALEIPYCHHERWDGTGYPRKLAGEAIPLAARIFAVVDVWDALMSARPYKPPWTAERSVAYLREQAGRLFDPCVVDAFLRVIEEEGLLQSHGGC